MAALGTALAPVPVRSLAEVGLDPDAKEAVAFAVLANQTLFGRPGNIPGATGATGPRVLGKLVL
jgi:anhydro-N-acetylmuramic acid kinase